jgi:phage/plasmid primase-like uncharacterized protein
MSASAFSREVIERARSVDILSVATHYGARLRKAGGGEFVGPCPLCGGRDRFSVNVRKAIWNCRGCGKGGDVIALVQHLSGCDFAEVIARLTGETWPTPQFAAAPPQRQRAQASPHRAAAVRIWHCAGSIFGTPAAAYLSNPRDRGGRNIDLAQIPDIDEVLRFHATCPIGKTQRPCLIALIRDVQTNAPMGIMRTPLSADGRKAPVRNANGELIDRWGIGDKAGGAIKLWSDAAVTNSLVVGEGLETVAAAATRIMHRGAPLQPAWALIDSGNLKHFPVLPEIGRLTVLVDNDANGAGQNAADACTNRWVEAGHSIEQLIPDQIDSDFNDVAEGSPHE